jgi:hypothetical protein
LSALLELDGAEGRARKHGDGENPANDDAGKSGIRHTAVQVDLEFAVIAVVLRPARA